MLSRMYVQESRSRLVRKNKQIVTTTIKAGQENKQTNQGETMRKFLKLAVSGDVRLPLQL